MNVFEYADFFRSEWDFRGLFRRLSEDFLRSLLLYFMLEDFLGSLPRSLPKAYAQSGTKGWCQVEFKLIYVEELYLTPCVIVLFMVCFITCMYTILVLNSFVNLKRC